MRVNDAIAAVTTLNKAIEKSILLCPSQYQWAYQRFAKPPAGVADMYLAAKKIHNSNNTIMDFDSLKSVSL